MAINPATLQQAALLRAEIRRMTDAQAVELTRAWVTAWDGLLPDLETALDELASGAVDGRVSRAAMLRSRRLTQFLAQAEDVLGAMAERMEADLLGQLADMTRQTVAGQLALIDSQLPPVERRSGASVNLALDQPDPGAIQQIIARTLEQIHAEVIPLPGWVAARMKSELTRGMILGDNPRTTARRIIKATGDQFNGGLARATNIARTEFLDAHRRAAQLVEMRNADILTGWLWQATLDSRTCPSCIAKHGTEYPLDQFGPEDHQQGRCTRVPQTKSWKELGITQEEPASTFPDAREWYDGLTEDTQQRIMGPTRWQLLNDGSIGWEDLSGLRHSANWRDSYGVISVTDLLVRAK